MFTTMYILGWPNAHAHKYRAVLYNIIGFACSVLDVYHNVYTGLAKRSQVQSSRTSKRIKIDIIVISIVSMSVITCVYDILDREEEDSREEEEEEKQDSDDDEYICKSFLKITIKFNNNTAEPDMCACAALN